MKRNLKEMKVTATAYSLAVVIMLVLVVFLTEERPSQGSAYSDDWDDMSLFRENLEEDGYETECIMSNINLISRVEKPQNTLLIAAGVERSYTIQEAKNIVDYVVDGGHLLVLDDFNNGNSLGEYFGVNFRKNIMWESVFQRNASFAVSQVYLKDSKLNITNKFNVTLNTPSTLESTSPKATGVNFDLDVFMNSSGNSWEDTNNNGIVDALDKRGPFELGKTITPYYENGTASSGRAIFISDADFILNGMWNLTDNEEFSMELVRQFLPDGGTVIFDESRHLHETNLERGFQSFLRFFVSFSITSYFEIRLLVIAMVAVPAFTIIYLTPVPRFREHRFDITYDAEPPPMSSLNELRQRIRKIFISRLKNVHHLFVDVESMIAYDLNNYRYDLKNRDDLMAMVNDEVLVKFLLSPGKNYSEKELKEIALHVQRWNSE